MAVVSKGIANDRNQQQRLSKDKQQKQQQQKQKQKHGWFFDDGNYDPFRDDNDCYNSLVNYYSPLNCSRDGSGRYYNRFLGCEWDKDYEYCTNTVCVPKNIPSGNNRGDGKNIPQKAAVVCTTSVVSYDASDIAAFVDYREMPMRVNRICSSTFVKTTTPTAESNTDGGDNGKTTIAAANSTNTMEYTFCFTVKENEYKTPEEHECQSLEFGIRESSGNHCTDRHVALDCSVCGGRRWGSWMPAYTNYQEIMKRGGNLRDYGIAGSLSDDGFIGYVNASTTDFANVSADDRLCFSDNDVPGWGLKQQQLQLQIDFVQLLEKWNDPFNRLDRVRSYCPLVLSRYYEHGIFTVVVLGPILAIAAMVLFCFVRRRRRRCRNTQQQKQQYELAPRNPDDGDLVNQQCLINETC